MGNYISTSKPYGELLGVPPELRNRIYRYALVEQDIIEVTVATSRQPGLLRTCQQTRHEASGIFYGENKFCLRIQDLHLTAPKTHWVFTKTDHPFRFGGSMCWGNFKKWLKMYHAGLTYGLRGDDDPYGRWRIVGEAFSIVDSLEGVGWAQVEKVLESFRKVVDDKDGEDWVWE